MEVFRGEDWFDASKNKSAAREAVRYWKGIYDEDIARDRDLHRKRGLREEKDEGDFQVFRVLIAVQIAMVSLAAISLAELLWNSR